MRFPDAPTQRGVKHLKELQKAVTEGYRAYVLFVVQMSDVKYFEPNIKTHPEFAFTFEEAQKAGVEVWFLPCKVQPDNLYIGVPSRSC